MPDNLEQQRIMRQAELTTLKEAEFGVGGSPLTEPMTFGREFGHANYGEAFRAVGGEFVSTGNVEATDERVVISGKRGDGTKVTITIEKGEDYVDPQTKKAISLLCELHPELAVAKVSTFVKSVVSENNGEGLYGVTLGDLEKRMLTEIK